VDSADYLTLTLQPTDALREEARQAAESAFTLQPNLAEAVVAEGYYHYACLKDYDTAVRYFEQARPLLPNSSPIPESLAVRINCHSCSNSLASSVAKINAALLNVNLV
jgi:tetratricopeptide (TPR) repeat protein